MKFDLHIHSKYSSDGILEPVDIVKFARNAGLSGVAVTDHNNIRGGLETKCFESANFQVIVGAEIMTDKGEITGLFLTEEIKSSAFYNVLAEIKNQGGLVIIPHPFDKLRSSSFPITSKYVERVDAIEGFNSRCVFNKYNLEATQFAWSHGLSIVAGSDAHYGSEIGNAGIITDNDDVREAILRQDLQIFGKHSPINNHIKTLLYKVGSKL